MCELWIQHLHSFGRNFSSIRPCCGPEPYRRKSLQWGCERLFTNKIHLPCSPYANGLFIELIFLLITHKNHLGTSFLLLWENSDLLRIWTRQQPTWLYFCLQYVVDHELLTLSLPLLYHSPNRITPNPWHLYRNLVSNHFHIHVFH